MKKALFLDRDGVINLDTGYTYKIKDFLFIDGIFELCQYAQQQDFIIIIITNQAGIARGCYSEDDFHHLTNWMLRQFKKQNINIAQVYYCPYHPTAGIGKYKQDSTHRKPNPGMILDAIREHDIDPKQSIIIGDQETDIEAGTNANIPITIIVNGNHNLTEASYKFTDLKQLLLEKNLKKIFTPIKSI